MSCLQISSRSTRYVTRKQLKSLTFCKFTEILGQREVEQVNICDRPAQDYVREMQCRIMT